ANSPRWLVYTVYTRPRATVPRAGLWKRGLVFRFVVRVFHRRLEFELGHAERDDVAVAQEAAGGLLAVHQHAVLRAQVDDLELVSVDRDACVLARDRAVEDPDAVLRGGTHRDHLAHQRVGLSLGGALLANDSCFRG